MKKKLILIFTVLILLQGYSQVGIGTTTPNVSAKLDVNSVSKGVLIPRMSQAQRNAISSPANGLLVYVTDDNNFYFFNGSSWKLLSASVDNDWTVNFDTMYNNNSGMVGIGTSNPKSKLYVEGKITTSAGYGFASRNLADDGNINLLYTNSNNTIVNSNSGNDILFTNQGVFKTCMKANGNLGIGTRNPTGKLEVISSNSNGIVVRSGLFESTHLNIWSDNTKVVYDIINPDNGFGHHFYVNGNEKVRIDNNGNVGIGTNTPTAKLSVNGVADKPGGGTWSVFSDARSKKNIQNYTKGIRELVRFKPVTFNYKEEFGWGKTTHVGLIAQDVEKIAPSMVTKKSIQKISDFKVINPNEITYMLINAVKELKAENDTLKKRIENLEKKLK